MGKFNFLLLTLGLGVSTVGAASPICQSEVGAVDLGSAVKKYQHTTLAEANVARFGKLPRRVGPTVPELITNPEGNKVDYLQAGERWTFFMGFLPMQEEYSKVATDIVFGDNNEIYLKNLVTGFPVDTYIKGVVEGDKAVFELPQVVYYEKEQGEIWEYYLQRLEFEELEDDGEGTYTPAEDQDLVFTIADGTLSMEGSSQEMILGITNDEGGWLGYGDYNVVLTPNTNVTLEVPENLTTEEYQLISNYTGHNVYIGFDGQDVYIKGLSSDLPESWVKARLEGDKIIYDKIQYVGTSAGYMLFVIPGSRTINDKGRYAYKMESETVFEYDAAKKRLSTEGGLFVNTDMDKILFREYFDKPLIHQLAADRSYVPKDIIPVAYLPYSEENRASGYQFYLPNLSVDNYLLDKDKMFWELYVDGELYVFEPYLYPVFTQDVVEVPFNVNSQDILNGGSPLHELHLFFEGDYPLGIRSIYKASAEEVYYSQYVLFDPNESGVENVEVENTDTPAEYYDLWGRRVANPVSGQLYIVKRGAEVSKLLCR